ncbi:MAG TPA: PIN domain-containing protein [Candidatus Angelobacter sp.]
MRHTPDVKVIDWIDKQPRASLWTSSVTVLEARFGLEIMPAGKRRFQLTAALQLVLEKIERRVLPFDNAAAEQAAILMAARRKKGRPQDFRDTMIAGIVAANHATLATGKYSTFP